MYKNIIIIVMALVMVSCTSASETKKNNTDQTNTNTAEVETTKPEHLTYETFIEKVWDFESNPTEWVYKGDIPCVIDFYADWCKPCKMIAPIMEDLAQEYDGRVKIYKIDTQTERKLAQVFQIRGIPAVLFSPVEGKPMLQTGAMPKESYVKIIEDNLLNKQIQNSQLVK